MTMDERLAQLEQRLMQTEHELGWVRQRLHAKQSYTSRVRGLARAIALLVVGALTGVATSGTAAAGSGPQPLTVQAPFRVVSGNGAPVLEVSGGGMRIYREGRAVVAIGGNSHGGIVVTNNSAGQATTSMNTGDDGSGLLNVGLAGSFQAQLGTKNGLMSLRFYHGATLLAGIGEGLLGGTVEVNDRSGKLVSLLQENAFGGLLQLSDATGKPRAALGYGGSGNAYAELDTKSGGVAAKLEGRASAGYLLIGNGTTARVEAGVLASDEGVVRAFGPGGFNFIRGRG